VLALTAGLGILSILPFLAIQLVGIGKVLAATTRDAVPQELAVLLCAGSVGVYVFVGGARAAVWTDALQGLIALSFVTVSAVLFASWAGGTAESAQKLQQLMPEKLVFNRQNTPVFVDNVLSWTFAFFLWPHVFQRIFMARTPGSLRRTAGASLVVLSFLLICLFVMTVAATSELYGKLDDPDQLLSVMFQRHLPVGGALLSIVIFALAMSTVDSMLLALSSTVSRWAGTEHRRGEASRADFARGRWITLGFLTLAALFGITTVGRGAITPWVTLGASLATLLLWPLLGMFVWPTSARSVCTAMSLGFAAICAARFTPLGQALPFGFATAGFLAGSLSFVAGGLVANLSARRGR
jgi:SSS family solute:Na+ symporter